MGIRVKVSDVCNLLILSLFLMGSLCFASDVAPVPTQRQQQLQLGRLTLALTIDPEQRTLSGWAAMEIAFDGKPNAVVLNLDRTMIVNDVWIDGQPVRYQRQGHLLVVPVQDHRPLTLKVAYGGRPRVAENPPWSGGFNWSRDEQGNPWVGVTTQHESGMLWLPCIGGSPAAKFRGAELRFTVPADLFCASNGKLVSQSEAVNGRKTYVWRTDYPIAHYNLNMNIGRYKIHQRTYHGRRDMPIIFYALETQQKADAEVDPQMTYAAKIDRFLDLAQEYLTFYAKWYGEYPFIDEKFGSVHTDYYGMEHQTINAYGNHFKIDDGYDYILLHEMGHEWWGNKVTVANWADFWMHEGICTYTTGIYLEERYGVAAADAYFKGLNQYLANTKPIVQRGRPDSAAAYHNDLYYKGALVVYALRGLLGREPVDEILRAVATDPHLTYEQPASTADFIAHAERISGQDLGWFFDVYLYTAALPRLQVTTKDKTLHLKWERDHFPMPIEVGLGGPDGDKIQRLSMRQGTGSLVLPDGWSWVLDPRGYVLKEMAPAEEAKAEPAVRDD